MIKNNTFYILRHGQTEYQETKNNFIYPWEECVNSVGLTQTGKNQIREKIKEVSSLGIDYIYSSDFKRARETAEIILQGINLSLDKIVFTSKLRDINLGIYHNGLKDKFYNDFPDFFQNFYDKPEKGESLAEAKKRILDFILEIDNKHSGKNILIVSHGEPLWLLEGTVKWKNVSDLVDKDKMKKNYIKTGELRKLNQI